jgi:hypothetical protein
VSGSVGLGGAFLFMSISPDTFGNELFFCLEDAVKRRRLCVGGCRIENWQALNPIVKSMSIHTHCSSYRRAIIQYLGATRSHSSRR